MSDTPFRGSEPSPYGFAPDRPLLQVAPLLFIEPTLIAEHVARQMAR